MRCSIPPEGGRGFLRDLSLAVRKATLCPRAVVRCQGGQARPRPAVILTVGFARRHAVAVGHAHVDLLAFLLGRRPRTLALISRRARTVSSVGALLATQERHAAMRGCDGVEGVAANSMNIVADLRLVGVSHALPRSQGPAE